MSYYKGQYDTDLSNISEGCDFPSNEVVRRNKIYKQNMRYFNGDYGKNKKLIALVDDIPQEINYKCLTINRFELVVNKLDALLFGNEVVIKTGNNERDRLVNKLVYKTGWLRGIRRAVKLCEIYGDSIIKTYKDGVSAISPQFGYKVLDASNKDVTKLYVLHELLYDKNGSGNNAGYVPSHIRILISGKGFDYERVFEYKGNSTRGTLGKPVRYKYKDRWISKNGTYYYSGIDDCETVQWLSVNTEKDSVYGSCAFDNIKEIVLALENRLSTENWIIDNHGKPILLIGLSSIQTNEKTGTYTASIIEGKYMLQKGDGVKPEYLTWDGKLSESKQLRDDLTDSFYELSEMGRSFLSGEYKGNISQESLETLVKGAIDRGYRDLNDLWYEICKSLYVLCRLNNIDIALEDINVDFNIGRSDDNKLKADICKILYDTKLFSKKTLLNKFWGYSDEDAVAEEERINQENENVTTENNINDY